MQGTVQALFITPEKNSAPLAMKEVQLAASGFSGDFHASHAGKRQILMVSEKVLRDLDLMPGSLRENIVISGIDVMSLPPGQNLQVGEAVLEVTVPCEPCVQMERLRPGLRSALDGRRGMFARVLSQGLIRVGDAVGEVRPQAQQYLAGSEV